MHAMPQDQLLTVLNMALAPSRVVIVNSTSHCATHAKQWDAGPDGQRVLVCAAHAVVAAADYLAPPR